MKKQIQFFLFSYLLFSGVAFGQNVQLEGYIFEDNNRGFLNEVLVDIYDASTEEFITKSFTNIDGLFTATLPIGKDYLLKTSKDLFFPKEEIVSTKGKTAGDKVYTKIKLERKPGYIFDVTLAEKGAPKATVNAITGAQIEVFNNTIMEEVLVVDSLAGINFDVTFERGNHYTVLIRKEGYFNKRLEAYVDVEGCILCFEGVGTVTPGVSDVMSEGFQMGSVLANIELEPARLNRTMEIENIYYDLDKYYIRDDAAIELDKVVKLLNDNPAIIIELGSHTDSRGGTRHNMQLSSNRAKAAVAYILENGGFRENRISAKGYGETTLVNDCTDGVKCSEAEHQKNRRTELKIIGFEEVDPLENRSLADMLIEEKLLREVFSAEQIQVKPGEVPDFDKLDSETKTHNSTISKSTTQAKGQAETTVSKSSTKTSEQATLKTNSTTKIQEKEGAIISIQSAEKVINSSNTVTKENKVVENASKAVETPLRNFLKFDADKVMVVQNGTVELVTKMIGDQLNTRLIDLLTAQKISLVKGEEKMTYKFASLDQIPIDILRAFEQKVAMVNQQQDGWHLYSFKEEEVLPKGVLEALK